MFISGITRIKLPLVAAVPVQPNDQRIGIPDA